MIDIWIDHDPLIVIRLCFVAVVKGNDPYVTASAVFGLNGLISSMYNGFVKLTGRDVRSFKTKE